MLQCCFFATVRILCRLTDDDLAGFAVLTHHVETLTKARKAGAEIAAGGRVDGGSGRSRGRDGGDATGCRGNGYPDAVDVYRVLRSVLEEDVDGLVALNGDRVLAIVQVFQACPLLDSGRHELLEHRIDLYYLVALVAVEGIELTSAHEFEDVVIGIGRCGKAAVDFRFA